MILIGNLAFLRFLSFVFRRTSSAESSRTDGVSDNEEQLAPFREKVQAVVSTLIDDSLSMEPDQGKGRKKTVQVI